MSRTYEKVVRFLRSEDGPTTVEYAVMLGLILIAIIGLLASMGDSVNATFENTTNTMRSKIEG
jgi:pilus assembly protein Flp/PilA